MAQTHEYTLSDFQAVDPDGGRNGRWLCPAPECSGHRDPRRHRSVSLDENTGLWNCKRGSCGARGQLKEKWKPMSRVYESPAEKRAKAARVQRENTLRVMQSPREPIMPTGGISTRDALWRAGSLKPVVEASCAMEFLGKRGFAPSDAATLHWCGVRASCEYGRQIPEQVEEGRRPWPGCPAIVFPAKDIHGKTVAIQGRRLEVRPGQQKATTMGPRSLGVFSTFGPLTRENLLAGPVAIHEAPLDALSMAIYGVRCIALMGSSGLPKWLLDEAFGAHLALALDRDDAGDAASEKLDHQLRQAGALTARWRPPAGVKDWNELLQVVPEMLEEECHRLVP